MKYTKKPVTIDAVQWDGTYNNLKFIENYFPDLVTTASNYHPDNNTCSYWRIRTLEGSLQVSEKDFIIKGVAGEFYPCKPDIFAKTYSEGAPDPASPSLLVEALRKIDALEPLLGRKDCTWGGTKYDSLSVSFGQTIGINEAREIANKALALHSSGREGEGQEEQDELWNEIGAFIYGSPSFKWYTEKVAELKSKYHITLK